MEKLHTKTHEEGEEKWHDTKSCIIITEQQTDHRTVCVVASNSESNRIDMTNTTKSIWSVLFSYFGTSFCHLIYYIFDGFYSIISHSIWKLKCYHKLKIKNATFFTIFFFYTQIFMQRCVCVCVHVAIAPGKRVFFIRRQRTHLSE